MIVALHFLLLAIGEVLKREDFVTAQKLQDYITKDDAFGGMRVPLADCRLALDLMNQSGFIKREFKDGYVWENHPEKYNDE